MTAGGVPADRRVPGVVYVPCSCGLWHGYGAACLRGGQPVDGEQAAS